MHKLYPVLAGELQGAKQFTIHNCYGDIVATVEVTTYADGTKDKCLEMVDQAFENSNALQAVMESL